MKTRDWFHIHVDAYVSKFNELDLKFRRVSSRSEFLQAYSSAIRPPTQEEEDSLRPKLNEVRRHIAPFSRLATVPFQLKVLHKDYCYLENDMPHTHGDTIVLPQTQLDRMSVNTLIHELLHVFQRYYPTECFNYYKDVLGYQLKGLIDQNKCRSNPDIDDLQYEGFNNAYREEATGIRDIVDLRDHPHEVFAYATAAAIERGTTQAPLRSLLHGK